MIYDLKRREEIKTTLQTQFNRMELMDLVKSILVIDKSLSQTIGPDWVENSTGVEMPYDVIAVMGGFLEPDENGILRSK